ncbi:glutathione S-transferase [Mycena alexandri]|uniref:glutathione transferase n=1 Tax=Mycena alexandri TaxID=1745969 RepID=A0AAD6SU93_9AGAR|nr:glutathione S-transferase [Mycena alexandri]
MLKLYVSANFGGGGAIVAMVLAEKDISYETIFVDLAKKESKTPEFLAMHPFGQVPLIDDDGFILYESRAICRYLAEKYADKGPALLPTGLKAKAIFEQAASVESANFSPALMKVAMEALGKPRRGLPVDQAVLDEALVGFSEKLDAYEVILGKQKFAAGDELSVVDIFHLMYAPALASRAGIDIMTKAERPNVTRWWNELIARPAWVKLQAEGYKVATES